jgi:enoyl-CoA hydratase/carnithine racemase
MKSDRGFFCFPEVNIGIMFFPGMNALTKKVISMPKFLEMQFTGNRYTALELEKYDIIRKACADRNELMKESIAFAKTFQKKRGIFGEMKRRMYKDIIDIMEKVDPAVSIEPLDVMRAD